MTDKNIQIDQDSNGSLWSRYREFGLLFVELAFVLAGGLITFMSYLILNVTIQDMVHDDYDRVTQNTVKTLVKELTDMEFSILSSSAVLSLSQDVGSDALTEKLRETMPQLESFDQVLWIYQVTPGRWQFTNIFMSDDNFNKPYKFSVKPDKNLLTYLQNNKIFDAEAVRIVTDLKFQKQGSNLPSANMKLNPFALVKAVQKGAPEAGFIVGVGTAGAIMEDNRLWDSNMVSSMTIREIHSGYELYHMERSAEREQEMADMGQVYEFNFGNSKWEVRTEFMKEQKIQFLEAVPFFVIIFGFIITAFVTLYVHNNQKKSSQVKRMYATLEQKNTELELEITNRARLNQALVKAEQDNRAIIDSVSDIIFETDTDGKILFLSARWRKVTGFDPEQSKGLELFKMLHPQDQEAQRRDFDLMVSGQKQAYRSFTRMRTSDGTFRAVELAVSMIRQDKSNILRVVGTITDVEERRRAERALGEAEKKYRAIVENAAGGIYQLTPEGLYLSANPAMARILGFKSPEEILRSV